MSTPKPSDLAHQKLRAVKRPTPLQQSLDEVTDLLEHFHDQGYRPDQAIQLTDITLNNIVEEQ